MISLKARFAIGCIAVLFAAGVAVANWPQLAKDGLHDPANPAIEVLQEPAAALGVLPPDSAGNRVDWVRALEEGHIQPRTSLEGDDEPELLDLDVLMTDTYPLRHVRFAHRAHSLWMDCDTCHDGIFVAQTGANAVNMGRILAGDFCGVCHGAVAFPLTECDRCHNTQSGGSSAADTAQSGAR